MKSDTIIVLIAAVLASALPARAAVILDVANYGVDSGACGPLSAAPCRSISQAITNASAGDTILVGPGRYGDLDGNGTLGGTGEESVTIGMVDVNKAVTILSTMGASATVIDATGFNDAIYTNTPGVVIGKANQGFTIPGVTSFGIYVDVAATGASIAGNFVTAAPSSGGVPIYLDAPTALARDNRVRGDQVGLFWGGSGAVVERNACSGAEFGLSGETDGATVQKNVLVDNTHGGGFSSLSTAPALVTRNLVVGNHRTGLGVSDSTTPPGLTVVFAGNNFYGNGDYATVGQNCGVIADNDDVVNPLILNADSNYWGDAAPGQNPADAVGGVCNTGVGVQNVTAANPAAAPFMILLKALR